MADPLYSCKYCKKKFFNERTFMKHTCTPMERSREIQTAVGQQAYGLYKIWLEKQRRKPPPIEGFLTSSYYTAMINFAKWTRETGIVDPKQYVELMVEKKISPSLWKREECYSMYMDSVDKSDPLQQAETTINTIWELSDIMKIEMADVFKQFRPAEIGELIQQRRLSPWLLFCSKSFKDWVGNLHDGERAILMKSIGIEYWAAKLEQKPETVKKLKEYAEQFGI